MTTASKINFVTDLEQLEQELSQSLFSETLELMKKSILVFGIQYEPDFIKALISDSSNIEDGLHSISASFCVQVYNASKMRLRLTYEKVPLQAIINYIGVDQTCNSLKLCIAQIASTDQSRFDSFKELLQVIEKIQQEVKANLKLREGVIEAGYKSFQEMEAILFSEPNTQLAISTLIEKYNKDRKCSKSQYQKSDNKDKHTSGIINQSMQAADIINKAAININSTLQQQEQKRSQQRQNEKAVTFMNPIKQQILIQSNQVKVNKQQIQSKSKIEGKLHASIARIKQKDGSDEPNTDEANNNEDEGIIQYQSKPKRENRSLSQGTRLRNPKVGSQIKLDADFNFTAYVQQSSQPDQSRIRDLINIQDWGLIYNNPQSEESKLWSHWFEQAFYTVVDTHTRQKTIDKVDLVSIRDKEFLFQYKDSKSLVHFPYEYKDIKSEFFPKGLQVYEARPQMPQLMLLSINKVPLKQQANVFSTTNVYDNARELMFLFNKIARADIFRSKKAFIFYLSLVYGVNSEQLEKLIDTGRFEILPGAMMTILDDDQSTRVESPLILNMIRVLFEAFEDKDNKDITDNNGSSFLEDIKNIIASLNDRTTQFYDLILEVRFKSSHNVLKYNAKYQDRRRQLFFPMFVSLKEHHVQAVQLLTPYMSKEYALQAGISVYQVLDELVRNNKQSKISADNMLAIKLYRCLKFEPGNLSENETALKYVQHLQKRSSKNSRSSDIMFSRSSDIMSDYYNKILKNLQLAYQWLKMASMSEDYAIVSHEYARWLYERIQSTSNKYRDVPRLLADLNLISGQAQNQFTAEDKKAPLLSGHFLMLRRLRYSIRQKNVLEKTAQKEHNKINQDQVSKDIVLQTNNIMQQPNNIKQQPNPIINIVQTVIQQQSEVPQQHAHQPFELVNHNNDIQDIFNDATTQKQFQIIDCDQQLSQQPRDILYKPIKPTPLSLHNKPSSLSQPTTHFQPESAINFEGDSIHQDIGIIEGIADQQLTQSLQQQSQSANPNPNFTQQQKDNSNLRTDDQVFMASFQELQEEANTYQEVSDVEKKSQKNNQSKTHQSQNETHAKGAMIEVALIQNELEYNRIVSQSMSDDQSLQDILPIMDQSLSPEQISQKLEQRRQSKEQRSCQKTCLSQVKPVRSANTQISKQTKVTDDNRIGTDNQSGINNDIESDNNDMQSVNEQVAKQVVLIDESKSRIQESNVAVINQQPRAPDADDIDMPLVFDSLIKLKKQLLALDKLQWSKVVIDKFELEFRKQSIKGKAYLYQQMLKKHYSKDQQRELLKIFEAQYSIIMNFFEDSRRDAIRVTLMKQQYKESTGAAKMQKNIHPQ